MQTRERHHVDAHFAQITVELAGEAEAGSTSRQSRGDQMVQVSVGWCGQLQSSEANIVESFVVDGESHVRILD